MGTAYDNLINGANARVFNYQPQSAQPTLRKKRGPYTAGYDATPAPTAPTAQPVPAKAVDPYENGGDGAIARETAPRDRSVSIGGGLPREELLRRMENASVTMRGSPSARAAMMGVYADSLKAQDQLGLDNNQSNGRNDMLTFQQNMQANMQQAQGKQQFGNDVALLNRKAAIEREFAPKVDPEKRALEMDKLRAEINNLTGKGAIDASKFDTDAQANYDKAINTRIEQLVGGSDDPELRRQAGVQAARERIALTGDAESMAAKAQLMGDSQAIGEALGAWKRLGGPWTDNATRPIPAGTYIDPGDVTTDYGTADDDNNFNDWAGWIPWVEKDRRVVYTNPETGEKHTQWLDPGEAADANMLNAVDMYNTPAYRKKMEERRQLGKPKN